MAKTLLADLKARRQGTWTLDQKDSEFWIILNAGDILVNFWTQEEREEYDLERTWVLRRDEKNPFREDFNEEAETNWIYDDEDGMNEEEDPEVEKLKSWS